MYDSSIYLLVDELECDRHKLIRDYGYGIMFWAMMLLSKLHHLPSSAMTTDLQYIVPFWSPCALPEILLDPRNQSKF